MPTREQVLALLESTGDYRAVGQSLGVPPGKAFLIATGIPADGGDAITAEDLDRAGAIEGSTQDLAYGSSAPENPTSKDHVLEWMRGIAFSDSEMQRAALARDADPGEVVDPEETDVATVLTRDHDQVTNMLKQLKTIPGVSTGGTEVHLSRRASLVDLVTMSLSRHEASEEEHFWPMVRSLLSNGDDVAGYALAQEQEGKDILTDLGEAHASEDEFDQLVVKLDTACRRHVAFEDQVLLRIVETVPVEERRSLGKKILKGKRRAPTRPHRHAPTGSAPVVRMAGATAAVVDRVRDVVGDRPADRKGKASQDVQRARRAKEETEEGQGR
jgi:hemerythrin-like domain-containing protein